MKAPAHSRMDRSGSWSFAALVGALPLLVSIIRLLIDRPKMWLFGDQALTDISVARFFSGHTLLGPYSRYGWHHPGPIWFAVLAIFRSVGGGNPVALVLGYLAVNVFWIAAIVFVVWRWLGPIAGWIIAGLLAIGQWSFSFDRLTLLWNPYAEALPALLLILLCAKLVVSNRFWFTSLGVLGCVTFLIQTDLSTGVLCGGLVFGALLSRLAMSVRQGTLLTQLRQWPNRPWLVRLALFLGVTATLWVLPAYQQLVDNPGNVTLLTRYFSRAQVHVSLGTAIRASDTVLSSFPFRFNDSGQAADANPVLLTQHSIYRDPAVMIYFVVGALLLALFLRRGDRDRAALAGLTIVALPLVVLTASRVTAPLYPYLIVWAELVVVPIWLLVVLVCQDLARGWLSKLHRLRLSVVPPIAALVTVLVTIASFNATPLQTLNGSAYAEQAWLAVRPSIVASNVHSVLVDPQSLTNMAIAAAIADSAMRLGKQVTLARPYATLVDNDFAPKGPPQFEIFVGLPPHERVTSAHYHLVGSVNGKVPLVVYDPDQSGG